MDSKFPNIEDISLEQIYEWQERGLDSKKMPEEIVAYFDAMDKVRAMTLRFDRWGSKDAILDYLVGIEGLSRYLATKLYNQTVEFFYCDTEISKEAWLNRILDMMEKNIQASVLLVKDTNDGAKVNKMLKELADVVKELHPDSDELDDAITRKPMKLYTMTPEDVGLPSVNRTEAKKMIEQYPDLPEIVKKRIMQEAQIIPLEVFTDESQDAREQ